MSAPFLIRRSLNGVLLDANALAYLNAIGEVDSTTYYPGTAYEITGTQLKVVTNKLFTDIKDAALWTSNLVALWPNVLGTAASHKFNARDPRDLDAAFRLTYPSGATHGPTGTAWNGTTQYGHTFLDASTLPRFGHALSYYTRDAITESNVSGQGVMGTGVSGTQEMVLSINRGNKLTYYANSDAAAPSKTYGVPQKGAFLGVRSSASSASVLLNQSVEATSNVTDTGTLPAAIIGIGRGTVNAASQCASAAILINIGTTEGLAFNAILQAFHTGLYRQA
jgi:hypothetical protein